MRPGDLGGLDHIRCVLSQFLPCVDGLAQRTSWCTMAEVPGSTSAGGGGDDTPPRVKKTFAALQAAQKKGVKFLDKPLWCCCG